MTVALQRLCVYAGILSPVLLMIGLWPLAGFIPPPSPQDSASEVVAMFDEDATAIRIGMFFVMLGGGFYVPLVAVISAQIKRIEDDRTPALAYTQLAAGAPISILLIAPALIWSVAAFRTDIEPNTVRMLNDLAWLVFVMPFPLGFVQNLTIGVAILSDRSATPVFPRWVAYFNFWMALLIVPAGVIALFKTGPFAWNGLMAFWVPASVFFTWFGVMVVSVLRAIDQQSAGAGVPRPAAEPA